MMCCSCPPCLEAATHLLCAVCGVVLLVVVLAASPSLFISSQDVALLQSIIERWEEVSVECSSVAVVW